MITEKEPEIQSSGPHRSANMKINSCQPTGSTHDLSRAIPSLKLCNLEGKVGILGAETCLLSIKKYHKHYNQTLVTYAQHFSFGKRHPFSRGNAFASLNKVARFAYCRRETGKSNAFSCAVPKLTNHIYESRKHKWSHYFKQNICKLIAIPQKLTKRVMFVKKIITCKNSSASFMSSFSSHSLQ